MACCSLFLFLFFFFRTFSPPFIFFLYIFAFLGVSSRSSVFLPLFRYVFFVFATPQPFLITSTTLVNVSPKNIAGITYFCEEQKGKHFVASVANSVYQFVLVSLKKICRWSWWSPTCTSEIFLLHIEYYHLLSVSWFSFSALVLTSYLLAPKFSLFSGSTRIVSNCSLTIMSLTTR